MSFTRRYVLWLIAPAAAVTLPAAYVFLVQVIHLTPRSAMEIFGLLVATLLAVFAVVTATIRPFTQRVEEQFQSGSPEISDSMSRCLDRTESVALVVWTVAGLAFAIAGTVLVMPTALGFSYFLVAGLTIAFPSILWCYSAGKRQLVNVASKLAGGSRHRGREISLRVKIATVFIGSFIVSSAALVQLVSSRVSSELEQLAINSNAERFQRAYDSAKIMARVDARALDDLRVYVPNDYALHLIQPNGITVDTKDPLEKSEIEVIRQVKTGDSSSYVGPHVAQFGRLKDGSIFVLSVPWEQYRTIPRAITFYTVLIALLTTAVFTIATLLVARDITHPLRQLRDTARELAAGNFSESSTHVFSDDEVGHLADSFSETRSNLSRLLGRIGGRGTSITDGVRVITSGTESLLTRSQNQAELTENSSQSLENVRSGIREVLGAAETVTDLTQDASSRSLELQSSSEEIARNMDHLFQSVEKTSSSTTEMNASMNEMSNRTDVLAGIGDEVLSFVTQMQATVNELLSSSQATADISRQVRENAEMGGAAVDRTVDGINATQELTRTTASVLDDLQGSVGEIGRILSVIEEITGRTNLLALNAAIIAAQAGEHGQGFSVVADEIRELADRTRGSTKEISAIVKAVQTGSREAVRKITEGVTRVGENVDLARDAAKSLAQIVASANQSHAMATKISRSLDDQARASRHLHEVTARMSDHIAEMNKATTEQARGTEMLARESELVREIAGQVKNATAAQSSAGLGIASALERIAEDAREIRGLLERQLQETDRIADASRLMLSIAQQNETIARDFNETALHLVRSGQDFESEVARFRTR